MHQCTQTWGIIDSWVGSTCLIDYGVPQVCSSKSHSPFKFQVLGQLHQAYFTSSKHCTTNESLARADILGTMITGLDMIVHKADRWSSLLVYLLYLEDSVLIPLYGGLLLHPLFHWLESVYSTWSGLEVEAWVCFMIMTWSLFSRQRQTYSSQMMLLRISHFSKMIIPTPATKCNRGLTLQSYKLAIVWRN